MRYCRYISLHFVSRQHPNIVYTLYISIWLSHSRPLQLTYMQSVSITTKVVSLNPIHDEVNKTDHHDITEIFLKVALNTINQTKPSHFVCHQHRFNFMHFNFILQKQAVMLVIIFTTTYICNQCLSPVVHIFGVARWLIYKWHVPRLTGT